MDREDFSPPKKGGVLNHDDNPSVGDEVGEAVGGVSGTVAGAAIGSAAGPIGTIIGGIAGAVGGWWAGRTATEAISRFTTADDSYYRSAFQSRADRPADRTYEDFRPAYQLGHLAAENPDYRGRTFDAIESDLQRGWSSDFSTKYGDWTTVRPYAQQAYTRRSSVGEATRNVANKAVDVVDNVKDRIDNNPASKPGPDPTDRRF
ncbi:MAG TPA: hypothetical protein VK494_01370 [Gemmatimonadaceae bacterium]|nr:hypothetical protein [Gemmatimonadaceae bacterium]